MTYDYDIIYERYLRDLASRSRRILDIGGGRPFQKRLEGYRLLLADKDYLTLDIDPSTKPDVIGDAHTLPFPDADFDAVLHNSVFEHLHSPWLAAREIHRVLKPGGAMLAVIPWMYPYHARRGHYQDYWRFSQDGLRRLFQDFSEVEIVKMGRWWQTMGGFIPGYWRVRPVLEPLLYILDRAVSGHRSTTPFHLIRAIK